MLKFVILLSAIGCALGAAVPKGMLPQLDGRIVGGSNAVISSFPWQISIQRNGGHSCGGSIYTSTIIVTAAHCLPYASASGLQVRAGATYWYTGGAIRSVASFKNHENYNPNTMVNDIAVIRLSSPLIYSSTIRNIGLAYYTPANGAAAVVSGWGALYSGAQGLPNQLQSVNVNIVSLAICGSNAYSYGYDVGPSMICAASPGKDACQGDSGGPLVSGGVLVGVVSWGYGCADPNYPGVYADVAVLRSWIINNAKATITNIQYNIQIF